MNCKLLTIITIFFLIGPLAANAMPILDIDATGQLQGASNVEVNGMIYNVAFVDGTCNEIFSGCDLESKFDFHSQLDALTASQALLDQVFVGIYDDNPAAILGCVDPVCRAITPFKLTQTDIISAVAGNRDASNLDETWVKRLGSNENALDFSSLTFAVWTQAPAEVPEPGTLALLGISIVTMGLGRKRNQRRQRVPL